MSIGTNINAPYGLRPYSTLAGASNTGQTQRMYIASAYGTPLFRGDLVTLAANGTITQAAIAGAAVGVFMGCKYINSSGETIDLPYWTASTVTLGSKNAAAYVITDPEQLFAIQVSTTGGALTAAPAFLAADVNANFNYALAAVTSFATITVNGVTSTPSNNPEAGSTRTGYSGMYLNYATADQTLATNNFKVIDLVDIPGNKFTNYFMDVVVKINNHQYNGGTGTTGL